MLVVCGSDRERGEANSFPIQLRLKKKKITVRKRYGKYELARWLGICTTITRAEEQVLFIRRNRTGSNTFNGTYRRLRK